MSFDCTAETERTRMTTTTDPLERTASWWDHYWALGNLTSFSERFPQNYEGGIAAFWGSVFAALPSGARVLDIATGNGAVPLIAAQVSAENGRAVEIHGLDSADINPRKHLRVGRRLVSALERVHFHPRTSAEETGFPDAHFDLVTGQYALEYTCVPRAVRELKRIMQPGATGAFILHSDRSVVAKTSRREIEQCRIILNETRLFDRVRDLLYMLESDAGDSGKNDTLLEGHRAFSQALARIGREVIRHDPADLLRFAAQSAEEAYRLRTSQGLSTTLAYIDEVEAQIRDNQERLEGLLRVAVDERGKREITGHINEVGFQLTTFGDFFYDSGELLGWALRFRKP